MALSTLIQPRRNLAFPFIVLLYPLLWLVISGYEVNAVGRPITDTYPQVIALTAGTLIISYAIAVVTASVLMPKPGSMPAWARTVVNPSNATLVIVSAISLALGAYIVTSSVVDFPQWVDAVASPVGLIIGWPMVGSLIVVFGVENTFPELEIPFAVELLGVLIGAALTATWIFLLSGWLAGFVPPTVPGATSR